VVGVVLVAAGALWLPTIGLPWILDFARSPTWQKAFHAAGQVSLFGWFASCAWPTAYDDFVAGRLLALDAHIYYRGA
jgi:hypothetical protein